jgi:hypothetical protein
MRILALGAACLTVLMLAHTFSLGLFELSLVATAQAQSVPKSLEQGGNRCCNEGEPERLDGWHCRWAAVGHLHDVCQ